MNETRDYGGLSWDFSHSYGQRWPWQFGENAASERRSTSLSPLPPWVLGFVKNPRHGRAMMRDYKLFSSNGLQHILLCIAGVSLAVVKYGGCDEHVRL